MTAAHNRFSETADDIKHKEQTERSLFPHLQMLVHHHDTIWPDHQQNPTLAAALDDISIVHMRLGEYEKQKQLLERALKIKETHYGTDHPETGITLTNLGNACGDLGEYEKQKQMISKPTC